MELLSCMKHFLRDKNQHIDQFNFVTNKDILSHLGFQFANTLIGSIGSFKHRFNWGLMPYFRPSENEHTTINGWDMESTNCPFVLIYKGCWDAFLAFISSIVIDCRCLPYVFSLLVIWCWGRHQMIIWDTTQSRIIGG